MEPRVSFITLAVADIARTRAFYVDGLGWRPQFEDGTEVIMIQVAEHLVLSLWQADAFAAEVGGRPSSGIPPLTLAHNVVDRASVDAVLAEAAAAGAEVTAAEARVWGGYSGYFADPDGFRWEVCWNPGEIGKLVVPDVSDAG
ncbi:VOC family protein [Flexivirga sp.]|uniref:VOC family protein n=1 Tax=Flexivirga sp. TaxID=1962927 RepID=UPI003F80412A